MLFHKAEQNLKTIFISALILFFSVSLFAEKYATIISCRSGNSQFHKINKNNCHELVTLLKKRGFDKIKLFFDGGNSEVKNSNDIIREHIVSHLAELSKSLKPTDQFYLFIFGHANASPRRVSLATRKGRLSGKQLAVLLGKIRAEQFIFCLNTQSHGLIKRLAKPGRMILCATDSYEQLNPPHFGSFFITAWSQDKNGDLLKIAKKAGQMTTDFYNNNSLAAAENSQIYYKGKTLSYPYDGSKQQWLDFAMPGITSPSTTRPKFIPELEGLKINHPDIESRKKLQNARKLAQEYPQYAAVYTKRDISISLQKDNSSQLTRNEYIYLNKDIAGEFFTVFRVPVMAGSTSKITSAKVIYPDGSYADIQAESKDFNHQVTFSGLKKGCLVIRSAQINIPPPAQLPFYNKLIYLQSRFPVASGKVKLVSPISSPLKLKLYNFNAKPEVIKNLYSKEYIFTFNKLSAYTSLPGDPQYRKICANLMITTIKSWKDFTAWSQRMFHRAGKIDPKAEKFILELVKGCKTDTDKIKRIYNYLCSLRYLTTPVGAAAFRPRLPGAVINSRYGDCKDKANALVAFAGKLGIKAFHVLVNRQKFTDPEFPSWQFNHMIAYFPELTGYPNGLWLDATDGATPFGTLPPGDVGKVGMIIKENSYKFIKIKALPGSINLIDQDINLKLSGDKANLKGDVQITLHGLPAYYFRQKTKRVSPRSLKHIMNKYLHSLLPGFSIMKFNFANTLDKESAPMKIVMKVKGKPWMLATARAALGASVFDRFVDAEREYGLIINNNQQLRILQKLTVKDSLSTFKTTKCSKANKYLSLQYSSKADASIFSLDLKNGYIPTSEYSNVKKMISDFKNKINGDCK